MAANIGKLLEQLKIVAEAKAQRDLQGSWFQGSQTYLDAFLEEIEEVKEEIVNGRKCFLEDELGDLLWDFMCLLQHLELEGKIDSNHVYQRAFNKYSERVTDRKAEETWDEVKARQKIALQEEQDSLTK